MKTMRTLDLSIFKQFLGIKEITLESKINTILTEILTERLETSVIPS